MEMRKLGVFGENFVYEQDERQKLVTDENHAIGDVTYVTKSRKINALHCKMRKGTWCYSTETYSTKERVSQTGRKRLEKRW